VQALAIDRHTTPHAPRSAADVWMHPYAARQATQHKAWPDVSTTAAPVMHRNQHVAGCRADATHCPAQETT